MAAFTTKFSIIFSLAILANTFAIPLLDSDVYDIDVPIFDNRIVGGNETTIDKFPYQVSFRSSNRHICGGTLISLKHVVTAAHCVSNPSQPQRYSILAGSTTRKGDEHAQISIVAKLIKHAQFNPKNIENDIALVFILKEFTPNTFVQPTSLPEYDNIPEEGAIVTISGWGTTSEGGSLPTYLQYVTKSIVTNKKCNDAYSGMVKEGMLCAGTRDGGKDSCQGDSGGPLTLDGVLTGVVSWGRGCGRVGYPGVYTRVSKYTQWIHKHISEN